MKKRMLAWDTLMILIGAVSMLTACEFVPVADEEAFTTGAVTRLTADQWKDGYVSSSNREQWFKFTASARDQYIYIKYDSISRLYIQLYDRNGNTLGDPIEYRKNADAVDFSSQRLTRGQIYYIQVMPYSSYYGYSGGTYQIAFNGSATAPEVIEAQSD